MRPARFAEKLARIQKHNRTDAGLLLAPQLSKLPLSIRQYDDPFLPFGKAIIDATHDLVCAYVFSLAAYLSFGAAGAVALERTIAYASREIVTILHGPFASPDYTHLWDEGAFGTDAITISESHLFERYDQIRADRGLFTVSQDTAEHQQLRLAFETVPLTIHVAGETVLYAGHGEDFAERVRSALKDKQR